MTTTTMRALEQTSWRGPADLREVTVPVPTPGPGEALVRVTAAGVNFADVLQSHGRYGGGPRPPYVAGFEAAGDVVAIGTGTDLEIGTHVVGTGRGTFAEYAVMPAADVAPIPPGWSGEQALGLVLNWATALAALRTGRLAAGETVLVTAAAGGVGRAAVTLARHLGARVIGAASLGKHGTVRADHVIDSRGDLVTQVRALTGGRGADLVLESSSLEPALVTPVTGRIVVYGTAGGTASVTNDDLVFEHQVQVTGLHIGALARHAPATHAALLAELADLRAAGVIPPGRPAVHDLADGPAVLADLEARATVGKLALRPEPGPVSGR